MFPSKCLYLAKGILELQALWASIRCCNRFTILPVWVHGLWSVNAVFEHYCIWKHKACSAKPNFINNLILELCNHNTYPSNHTHLNRRKINSSAHTYRDNIRCNYFFFLKTETIRIDSVISTRLAGISPHFCSMCLEILGDCYIRLCCLERKTFL